MDLATLKSAVEVTEPGKILRRLSEAFEASKAADPSHALHSTVRAGGDGALVRKASALGDFSRIDTKAEAPAEWEVRRLAEGRGIRWDDRLKDRAVPYWMSDERVDQHGDIVRQKWDLAQFAANPVMPWAHDWSGLPVGNILREEVRNRVDSGYTGPALWGLALFAMGEQYDFADTIFRLASGGFLRNGSVGFMPRKIIEVTDDKEREALGLGRHGLILEDNVLIEFSPCTIGANPGAGTVGASLAKMAQAKQKGLLRVGDFQVFRELARREALASGRRDDWREVDSGLLARASMLFGGKGRLPDHADVEQPIEVLTPEDRLRFSPRPKAGKARSIEERLEAIESAQEEIRALLAEGMAGLSTRVDSLIESTDGIAEAMKLSTLEQGDGGDCDDEDEDEDTGSAAAAAPALTASMTRVAAMLQPKQ